MRQSKYRVAIDYDAPGGPTHQASVRPGSEHLPVRGQPTIVQGNEGQVLPPPAPSCLIVKPPPPVAPPGAWMLHKFLL